MKSLFRSGSIQEEVVKEIAGGHGTAQIMGRLKITKKQLDQIVWIIKKKLNVKVRESSEAFLAIRKKYTPGSTSPPDNKTPDEPGSEPPPPPHLTDADLVKDMDDIDLAANILMNKIQKCERVNGMGDIVKRITSHAISEIKILVQVARKNKEE